MARLFLTTTFLGGFLGGFLGLALAKPIYASSTIHIPLLPYEVTRLSNGLKVITLEDHKAPIVTLEIFYRVGSKDEPPSKHGFAHLFEHLMFKGTSHMQPGNWDTLINEVGGDDNADTSFDRTRYYETVPANALNRVLWMEADRMANLNVDLANMTSERAVVEEEYRMDVDNAPYGYQEEALLAMLFPPNHPYAHATIGNIHDLEKASLNDVKAFHTEYYRPDNATLVLVGDFRTDEALTAIRKYFGAIPNPPSPPMRYEAPPIVQKAPKEKTILDPLAPLPQVTVAYRTPKANSAVTPVLEVIANLLANGDSSRLYRALVRQHQLANSVSAYPNSLQLGGWFECDVVANKGISPNKIIAVLKEEFQRLVTQLVAPTELEKAKRQAIVAHIFGLLSTQEKAEALGEADVLYGSPAAVNKEVEAIQKVTPVNIQQVAARYFAPNLCNILTILPSPNPGNTSTAGAKEKKK